MDDLSISHSLEDEFRQCTVVSGIPTGKGHWFNNTSVWGGISARGGKQMNRLNDLSVVCTDQRRVELARLLAAGVIRVLLQQKSQDQSDSTQTMPETSDGGLEDS